ncbi:MAG TPA: hypothetical protein VJ385_04700 [Fibrobacteria bacterium]|nr:hypothetical protein [Fibrobacteria bacterium]
MESALASVELTFQFLSPEIRTPELEDKLQAFKEKYLGGRGGRRFAAWKYCQGVIDSGDCVVFASTPEGEIAGHLGAVMFPSVPGSGVSRMALGTEFVVDEKFRGGKHDVIRRMDTMLGERLAGKGVELMYGVPNKPGYVVAKRLYRRVDGVKCVYLSKVFTPALAVPGRFRKTAHTLLSFFARSQPALLPDWAWSRPKAFEASEVDAFCLAFARKLEFGTFRNAAFLNWRYGGGDGSRYDNVQITDRGRVIGIAVIRMNPHRCVGALLMECMALDDQGYDALLAVCMRFTYRRAPALTVFGVKDSLACEAYLRHGFRHNADILRGIERALSWVPEKARKRLIAKAEEHFHLDDYTTLYYYPDPTRSKEFLKGRWYLSLGERYGF